MNTRERLQQYAYLMRLDKPIGILLLLWPTLWALWLAARGMPNQTILFVFVSGVVLMRSAGCAINDFADRHVDGFVARTKTRPLAAKKLTAFEACVLAGVLMLCVFLLVLLCNAFTIKLAFVGALLAIIYPFLKRVTHLPQFGLGLAFAFSVPMAFAAVTNQVSASAWFLFAASALWPVMYDTIYAMVDRDDDVRVGIKSTAILFGQWDVMLIAAMQIIMLMMFCIVGVLFSLNHLYYLSLVMVGMLFIYQLWLVKDRDRERCFRAFLNNNYVGMLIFSGIIVGLL